MAQREGEAKPSDFGVRLRSALVMAPVFIASVYFGGLFFEILIIICAVLMAWEWNRLCGGATFDSTLCIMAAGIVGALVTTFIEDHGHYPVFILFGSAVVLGIARLLKKDGQVLSWSFSGLVYIGLASLAVVLIRAEPTFGFAALVWLCVAVWSADTGAYIFGRMIGGPKLAPSISPAKTWAGFWGGTFCAGIAGLIAGYLSGLTDLSAFFLLSAAVGVFAQMGDLLESWIKRRFGVKDASNLIPGHGGVLDRVDGLMAAGVVVGALQFVSGSSVLAWF